MFLKYFYLFCTEKETAPFYGSSLGKIILIVGTVNYLRSPMYEKYISSMYIV